MKLIQSQTLGTAQATIDFTSIPQDGTDLVLFVSARSSNTQISLGLTFNGQTANRSERGIYGSGTGVLSFTNATFFQAATASQSGFTANTFGNSMCYIPNYTANQAKSFSLDGVNENNATSADQILVAGLWNDTAAITSFSLFVIGGGNLAAGTIASLYKITKGSDGIVTTS